MNFNAQKLLCKSLNSIYTQTRNISFDIWLVDNNSADTSLPMVRQDFLQVNLIENKENVGFAKACNQAIASCTGNYILLLNPDTLILKNALEKMIKFLDENPRVGIAGCKVLNDDGTLQLACRRSIPTPGVALARLTGLTKLLPRNKKIAKYNLTYMDPNQSHEVDAVSGSVLMIRREVIDEIGLLDETFFMYGEELDWCLRTRKAGWTVMYYPDAQIIHYKGECSKSNSRKATFEFYRAMYLFHKKHFAKRYSLFTNSIIYAGIFLKAVSAWRSFLFPAKVGSKA